MWVLSQERDGTLRENDGLTVGLGHQEVRYSFCHKDDVLLLYFSGWRSSPLHFRNVFLIRSLILQIQLLTMSPTWAAIQIFGCYHMFLWPCDCFPVWQKGVFQCGKSTKQDSDIITSNYALPGSPYGVCIYKNIYTHFFFFTFHCQRSS